jgi:hypothetical protein
MENRKRDAESSRCLQAFQKAELRVVFAQRVLRSEESRLEAVN